MESIKIKPEPREDSSSDTSTIQIDPFPPRSYPRDTPPSNTGAVVNEPQGAAVKRPLSVGPEDVKARKRRYCDRCDLQFRDDVALTEHFEESSKHNKCTDCDYDGSSWDQLLNHYRKSGHRIVCEKCTGGKAVAFPGDGAAFNEHLVKQNVCHFAGCENHFKDPVALRAHLNAHYGVQDPLLRPEPPRNLQQTALPHPVVSRPAVPQSAAPQLHPQRQNLIVPHPMVQPFTNQPMIRPFVHPPIMQPVIHQPLTQPFIDQSVFQPFVHPTMYQPVFHPQNVPHNLPPLPPPPPPPPTQRPHLQPLNGGNCYGAGCARNFSRVSSLLAHLESGGCVSEMGYLAVNFFAAGCSEYDSFIYEDYIADMMAYVELWEEDCPFFCPVCVWEFSCLSGFMQHAETSSCGIEMTHPTIVDLVGHLDSELRKW